jgi:hypothetical protein
VKFCAEAVAAIARQRADANIALMVFIQFGIEFLNVILQSYFLFVEKQLSLRRKSR